jgi:hypothetical protein
LSEPIACSILSEKENGTFERIFMSNDSQSKGSDYLFNYDVDLKRPLKIKKVISSFTQESQNLLKLLNVKAQRTCEDKFLEFILLPENRNSVFLSTNETSQNMSLVLKILAENNLIPTIVKKDNVFIMLKLKSQNITFLNVTNFFNGYKTEIAKQFLFPEKKLHFFPVYMKCQKNCFPDFSSFTHWLDSESAIKEKKLYYDSKIGQIWNFNAELFKYSMQQTEIVAHACLNFLVETFFFQKKTLQLLNRPVNFYIFPFTASTPTIASYSYALLKYFYLSDENLISSPQENICQKNKSSRPEMEYVFFMEYKYPEKKFIHFLSRPSGQFKFKHYSVDLYSPVTKEIFQFEGCFTHFHLPPDCLNPSRQNLTVQNIDEKKNYKTFREHLLDKQKFENFLQENFQGEYSNLVYIYECQWTLFKKEKEYLDFLALHKDKLRRPLVRLHPRTAQRGGLTETYQFYWAKESSPNSSLQFLDVCSMYPSVAMTFDFPVSQPTTVIGQDLLDVQIINNKICYKNLVLKFGFIFCEILPPQNLLWPFLQYRTQDSDVYLGLCKSCCVNQSTTCKHLLASSRSFISTWTLVEINKALELGYKVTNIFEVIFFSEGKPILKEYLTHVNSLRLANSFVEGEDKQKFCETINNDLGLYGSQFEVKPKDVCNNPMKKQFFKLMSNSVLGKLSSLTNFESTQIVQSQGELELLLTKHSFNEINVISENHVMVSFFDTFQSSKNNFNIYIGAYVSAYARVVLYDYMLKLKDLKINVLSIDTDCILFELFDGCDNPFSLSFTPGRLKPVYENCEILNYCSLGTRNYSIVYKDNQGNVNAQIKCKGLSLTSANLENTLSLSLYNEYLEKYLKKELQSIRLKQIRFKTQKKSFLCKKEEETHYSFNNNLFIKRIVNLDASSVPFGYVNPI